MGIEPQPREGELGHIGLGEDDGSGRAQSSHHRRVLRGRRRVSQEGRSGSRRFAPNVEQILDADNRSVERAEREAGFLARVGRVGTEGRGLRVDRQTGACALAFGGGLRLVVRVGVRSVADDLGENVG